MGKATGYRHSLARCGQQGGLTESGSNVFRLSQSEAEPQQE